MKPSNHRSEAGNRSPLIAAILTVVAAVLATLTGYPTQAIGFGLVAIGLLMILN